jgi:tetraprenyl-beta-curcumene synthase
VATALRAMERLSRVERSEIAALPDRWLSARACVALVLANARYWSSVAPIARGQLRRWEQRAQRIPNHELRALALEKLRDEHFNAEVAATLATLAPRIHRSCVVEAIIALEVMYDYLDGLTEQASSDSMRNGHQLFYAFTDALALDTGPRPDYYRYNRLTEDGGYLNELTRAVKISLAQLPATASIIGAARSSAVRCAHAQIRVHAMPRQRDGQLEGWARCEATGTALRWREWLAGAVASVLGVHALIAAAANKHTTSEQAAAIDEAYLSISALSTMLDSLIDYERDLSTGIPWYLEQYDDHDLLVSELAHVARNAVRRASALPCGAHHVMTLVGVVAYYTSAPSAAADTAQSLVSLIHRELRPLIAPTFAVMRAWRIAKRLRRRLGHKPPATNKETA